MKAVKVLLATLLAICAGETWAASVYTRQHELLVDAIKNSSASGELRGPVADLFTKQFKSQDVLMVTANVIHSYERQGCKRLRVIYTKHGVAGPKGPQRITMDTEMNYCVDGRPPMNLGRKV